MRSARTSALVAVVASLALPAAAAAHGSVYTDTSRMVAAGDTPPIPAADLISVDRHVVTNHGFTYVLRETNGASDHGMVDFSMLPGAYRNQPGFEPGAPGTRTRLLLEGDTAAQPHATCRGVASLDAEEAVLAWQGADPFYNYVPFQATSAGLEDDPALWIAVVQSRTGVNLATVTDFAQACTNLAGTYVPADTLQSTAASLASGTVEQATTPLEAEIDTLTAELATAQGELTAAEEALADTEGKLGTATTAKTLAEQGLAVAQGQVASLTTQLATAKGENAALKLFDSPLSVVTQAGGTVSGGLRATIEGRPLQAVSVRLMVSKAEAKEHGLDSRVLLTTTTVLGADGKTVVALRPARAARRAFARHGDHPHDVTVQAVSVGRPASATGKLG